MQFLCQSTCSIAIQRGSPCRRQERLAILPNGPIIAARPTEDRILLDHGSFRYFVQILDGLIEPEYPIDRTSNSTGKITLEIHTQPAVSGHAATFVLMILAH